MRNRYFLLLDVPLIAMAALGAFVLRFDLGFAAYRQEFAYFVIVAALLKPLTFFLSGVYGRYWPYASVPDLATLVVANTAASMIVAITLVGGLWADILPSFSRSVVVIDWLLTLTLIGGIRVAARLLREPPRARPDGDGTRLKTVLIAGAGQAGLVVARDLQRNPQLRMVPVGFLDDDPLKVGKLIEGLPVLGVLADLPDVAASRTVTDVIVAMPTAPGSVVRAVAEQCRTLSLTSQVIPGVFELLGGQVTVGRLRQVEITDLLRRSHARAAFNARQQLEGKVVLVTGAGGSIGREVCRQVADVQPKLLVMLGHGENSLIEARTLILGEYPTLPLVCHVADIRNEARLAQVFGEVRPEIVFHAAAYKHVPLMEENPEEALTNNALGTRNVVRAALAAGTARLVLISTDKAAAPVGIMGASKRLAEELVRQTARRFNRAFVVVRFGNVLGSRGSVVPIFQRQIELGGPITITHPGMKRYFMTIPEAAHLVLEAGALGSGGELFVLRMGEPVAIVDLARDMIRLSGADDIQIVYTGTRPGEKLNEILWESDATPEPTPHPDIVSINQQVDDEVDWPAAIEHLSALAVKGSRADLLAELKRYVPSFGGPDAPAGRPRRRESRRS